MIWWNHSLPVNRLLIPGIYTFPSFTPNSRCDLPTFDIPAASIFSVPFPRITKRYLVFTITHHCTNQIYRPTDVCINATFDVSWRQIVQFHSVTDVSVTWFPTTEEIPSRAWWVLLWHSSVYHAADAGHWLVVTFTRIRFWVIPKESLIRIVLSVTQIYSVQPRTSMRIHFIILRVYSLSI